MDEISQFAETLVAKRESKYYKNQIEFDKQLKRLKEEKERQDERVELELILELKDYFRMQVWSRIMKRKEDKYLM